MMGVLRLAVAWRIDYESQDSEERWQHAGHGCNADEVVGDRALLPIKECVGADAALTGTQQTTVS